MTSDAKNQRTTFSLLPTEDSFLLNLKRCVYQMIMWKQATQAMQNLPIPTNYGCVKDNDNVISPILMSQSISPPELLNNLVCECGNNCTEVKCVCILNNQPCTDACWCEDIEGGDMMCMNPSTIAAVWGLYMHELFIIIDIMILIILYFKQSEL